MIAAELRTLWSLVRGQPRGGSHAERVQAFYAPQATHYDCFRERLLPGRRELIEQLGPAAGSYVVELGAGTGRNAEYFGERLDQLARLELVDLCPALLAHARARARGRPNVAIIEADATRYRPARPADAVYFSYALTMIEDWRDAIDNAIALLRPGGLLGVVDFYVSGSRPAATTARHDALTRAFWPRWFAHSGVRLSPEHLPHLQARLDTVSLSESRAPVPYLPGLRVPYYVFVGRRHPSMP